jgi:hypothetical protein
MRRQIEAVDANSGDGGPRAGMSAMELSCEMPVQGATSAMADQSSPTLTANADLSPRGLLGARDDHNFAVGSRQALLTAPNQAPDVPRQGEFLRVINLRHERPEAAWRFIF